jgi:hypothetical protein
MREGREREIFVFSFSNYKKNSPFPRPPLNFPPFTFFCSGALLTIGFTNSLIVLTLLTMPGIFIVFFVLPDVVGRHGPTHKVSWSPREF